jgi:fatty-acyl-CoA synthase
MSPRTFNILWHHRPIWWRAVYTREPNNARFFAHYMRLTEQDRVCVPVPMFHCFGSVIGTMTAAVSGAACIFPAATFDALATLEAIDAEQATVIPGVPAMFIAESASRVGPFSVNSLRTGVAAGAPVRSKSCAGSSTRCIAASWWWPTVKQKFARHHVFARDDDLKRAAPRLVALPELRWYRFSRGQKPPAGEQGELLARGYTVMKGDGEPEATAQAIDVDGCRIPAI